MYLSPVILAGWWVSVARRRSRSNSSVAETRSNYTSTNQRLAWFFINQSEKNLVFNQCQVNSSNWMKIRNKIQSLLKIYWRRRTTQKISQRPEKIFSLWTIVCISISIVIGIILKVGLCCISAENIKYNLHCSDLTRKLLKIVKIIYSPEVRILQVEGVSWDCAGSLNSASAIWHNQVKFDKICLHLLQSQIIALLSIGNHQHLPSQQLPLLGEDWLAQKTPHLVPASTTNQKWA